MSTVAEIQAAVENLPDHERLVLLRWLEATDLAKAERHRVLLSDIDVGLAEADRGELIEGSTVVEGLRSRARGAA